MQFQYWPKWSGSYLLQCTKIFCGRSISKFFTGPYCTKTLFLKRLLSSWWMTKKGMDFSLSFSSNHELSITEGKSKGGKEVEKWRKGMHIHTHEGARRHSLWRIHKTLLSQISKFTLPLFICLSFAYCLSYSVFPSGGSCVHLMNSQKLSTLYPSLVP